LVSVVSEGSRRAILTSFHDDHLPSRRRREGMPWRLNAIDSQAMKTRIPRLCLFTVILGLANARAQNAPPVPGVSEEAQQFLNAPVWYFNYTVTIKYNETATFSTGGSRTTTSERAMNGKMMFGLRSQGPSLSVITGDAKPPGLVSQLAAQQSQALAGLGTNTSAQSAGAALSAGLGSITPAQVAQAQAEMDAFFNNYANWISGLNIDESKTDAENERDLIKVREENIKAFEHYRWNFTGSTNVGGHDRGAASGSGTVGYGGEPAFEIDGANRKFKLLFELTFRDSLQTQDALRGVEEFAIGTIHYQRREIKTGLHSGEHSLGELRPAYGIIEGVLPGGFGNISGQSLHSIVGSRGNIVGSVSVQYVLSPYPPEPVELIIEPPADYDKWRPIAANDEKTAGDVVPIKVVLRKPGGGVPRFKPMRYNFFLKNTSRERGVCLNWPPPPLPGSPAANEPPPFDLQFEQDKNQDYLSVGYDGQAMAHTVPTDATGAAALTAVVNVSCFDYGAYGEFEASAELENGQTVYGVVKFTSDQQQLKLPLCNDGSHIALSFLENLSHLPDNDDSENDPVGDRFTGDGLTLYEEYRGFMNGDDWTPGNPKKKDVFVLNQMRTHPFVARGIKLFESTTKLVVHQLLRDNQVDADMAINFSRTREPHAVDQHVIRIIAAPAGRGYANVDDNGTPGTAKAVNMAPDCPWIRVINGQPILYFAATLAHEMVHCCNVYHHGEKDETRYWYQGLGTDQILEQATGLDSQGNVILTGTATPITVKQENGAVVSAVGIFGGRKPERFVSLGMPQGQHSGFEECLMRYDIAFAYPSSTTPNVRYLTGGEPVGVVLCTSAAGSGVNAAGRSPQSRYGPAANATNGGPDVVANRGNCAGQLRVNDLGNEPKR
jgi:hypothetical protein